MKTKTLEQVMPIYKVEQDCILSKKGDITLAYQLILPEIFTLSSLEFEALHSAWVKAIRLLPNHTIIHKQDWFTKCSYKPDFSQEDISFLSRSSERFFNERPYLDHTCYLFLTLKGNTKRSASALNSSLLRGNVAPPETTDPLLTERFMDKAGQFVKIMQDTGFIQFRRMRSDEIASGEKPGLLEKYCYLHHPEEPPTIRDIQLKPSLKIGSLDCQLFTLADVEDLPSLCGQRISYDKYSTERTRFSIGFPAALCQLLYCNHLYNQYIIVDDAQKTLKKMEAKRLRLQSLSTYSRDNAISRDATNQYLNEAIADQRLPVKAHFNVLAWTEDPSEIKEVRNQVASALAQLDARAKQESVTAAQLFWAGMPGNAAELPNHEVFDTFAEQACCFLNNETGYRSSLSPVGLRLGERITGKPVHVDISDEPMRLGVVTNRSKFILGPSGSGKSFFTNHMVRSYHEQGAHIVLIDVGHSYKGLCEMVNGYYYTYTEKNPIRFNPFFLGNVPLDTEKKESIKTLLLAIWKKDDESFTRAEYIALSNALQQYYEHLEHHPELFPCFDTFYEFLSIEFKESLSQAGVKDKDFDISNFLYVLKPYAKGGEFDYLLNAKENLDMLDQRLLVFELDAIKDHPILLPVSAIIIMEIFISKMRKLKGIRKMILIEEAWKAITRNGMAEYIKYLFKTVRKFYGEAIVVTQDVDDIISSPIIKDTIINNADCKILLDQSKYINKFDKIQDLLGLNDKDKALILSMNKANDPDKKYKEVYINLGGVISKVYRTEVSLEEYLTYTTEEKEKVQVQAYAARYNSISQGITMLANHLREQTA